MKRIKDNNSNTNSNQNNNNNNNNNNNILILIFSFFFPQKGPNENYKILSVAYKELKISPKFQALIGFVSPLCTLKYFLPCKTLTATTCGAFGFLDDAGHFEVSVTNASISSLLLKVAL